MQNLNGSYTVSIEYCEETGEYFLPIPEEVISELNWNVDDILIWECLEDNKVVVRKKEEN